MPATFASTCSRRQQLPLAVLPLGSPIRPVPPPTSAIGEWPQRCRRASAMIGSSDADVQARRGRIEADVAGDRLAREHLAQRLRWRRRPGRATPTRHTGPSAATIQPLPSMELTRRAALKGVLVDGGVGARRPARVAYGVAYERHRLGVTEADAAGVRPAARARRPAHRAPHRHPPQRARARRRRRRAPWSSRCPRQPDLIVLGGDYVTFGDRDVRRAGGRAAARRCDAPHGVFAILGNHDDDRDMPAALARQRHSRCCKDQRTRLDHPRRALELGRHPLLDASRRQTSRACCAARGTDGRCCSRTIRAGSPKPRRSNVAGRAVGPHARRAGRAAGRRRAGARAVSRCSRAWRSEDNTSIFVSRGIGTVYVPVRINCPPEVALVTLRRQPALGRRSRRRTQRRPSTRPAAVEHAAARPRDRRGAPRRGSARPASPRCRRRAPARCAAATIGPASSSVGHEVHGDAADLHAVLERLPLRVERRETPAAATGGC